MTKKNLMFLLLGLLFWSATASSQVLGSGSLVRITVFGHPELSTVSRVSGNGTISFPLVGEINVAGLSERQAERKITSALSEKQIVQSPQVSLIIDNYQAQPQRASVLGEVSRPGAYPISSGSTVIDLIAEAGGLTREAGDVAIVTKKRDGATASLELAPLLSGESTGRNISLGSGDRVFVPRMKEFYIHGSVNRPGVYRLEKGMTVIQAISVAGGMTRSGTERGLTIKRKTGDGAEVDEIRADTGELVAPDDVIFVKESLF